VDDSALMRRHLHGILTKAGFDVETASNGEECLARVSQYEPTVITLDINMPVMDGLTCLNLIMRNHPTPVVMLSSLTKKGAIASFEALKLGAVDYIPKPGGTVSFNMADSANELIAKINSAALARIGQARGLKSKHRVRIERAESVDSHQQPKTNSKTRSSGIELILIGVSTGGPSTIQEIITALPDNFSVPIIIAQHMPARFTDVFADRLNGLTHLSVREVNRTTEIKPGHVYIAKGDADIKVTKQGSKLVANSVPADKKHLWHPSVDALVLSAVETIHPSKLLCIQLTGMGNDGATAMAEAHKRGAKIIAESEETAVVFGMPRELIALDAVDIILPCHDIANAIANITYK